MDDSIIPGVGGRQATLDKVHWPDQVIDGVGFFGKPDQDELEVSLVHWMVEGPVPGGIACQANLAAYLAMRDNPVGCVVVGLICYALYGIFSLREEFAGVAFGVWNGYQAEQVWTNEGNSQYCQCQGGTPVDACSVRRRG